VKPPAAPEDQLARLTERERQVLELLADLGHAKGVARRMGISVRTVETHLQNIRRKLDVETTLQAIAALHRNGDGAAPTAGADGAPAARAGRNGAVSRNGAADDLLEEAALAKRHRLGGQHRWLGPVIILFMVSTLGTVLYLKWGGDIRLRGVATWERWHGRVILGEYPRGFLFIGGRIWTTENEGFKETLLGIDPQTLRVTARVPIGVNLNEVVPWRDELLVSGGGKGVIVRIDPVSGRDVGRITVGSVSRDARGTPVGAGASPNAFSPTFMAVDGDTVWVVNAGDNTLSQLRLPGGEWLRRVDLKDTASCILLTPEGVWVALPDSGAVALFDRQTGQEITRVPTGAGANGLLLVNGELWVANTDADTITRIDPKSGGVIGDPIAVGDGPTRPILANDYVWVPLQYEGAVARINPATLEQQNYRCDGEPYWVGVADGAVWAIAHRSGRLVRVTALPPRP